MPVPTYTVTCTANRLIARDIYEVRFRKPNGFTFKPGQFVLFDVALLENSADIQTRAFSMASAPSEPDLLFVFKLVPGGRASNWVEKTLRLGSEAVMKGPFGNFVIKDADRGRVFVATSTGIAPFRSQLTDLGENGNHQRTDVIFGVRSEEDMFWTDELASIAATYPHIFLHVILSAPADSWTGHRGRVQSLVPQVIGDFTGKSLYACGNPDMTKEVKQLALTQWGMAKEHVHVEGYI